MTKKRLAPRRFMNGSKNERNPFYKSKQSLRQMRNLILMSKSPTSTNQKNQIQKNMNQKSRSPKTMSPTPKISSKMKNQMVPVSLKFARQFTSGLNLNVGISI